MEIFTKPNNNPDLSIALGYFDGMHLGHRAVIKSAVDFAQKNNLKSAVITLKEHPYCYLKGVCPKYILQNREEKFEECGIDFLYELDFDEYLKNMDAKTYLQEILLKNFSPKAISTGFNHYFGANKSGNAEFLKQNSSKFGYQYFEIQPEKHNGEIISSSKIRNYLQNGEIELANSMLGSKFSVSGKVVEGQKLGRQIGFRTANIVYPTKLIDIPFGVYSVETKFGKGIANFGFHPTINRLNIPVLEVHILNFDKDIYGQTMLVEFEKMIRKEQKFKSLDELKSQIAKDIEQI